MSAPPDPAPPALGIVPVLRVPPSLAVGGFGGGLTTRIGFPEAHPDRDLLPAADPSRALMRSTLADALKWGAGRFAWTHQVHGSTVVEVTSPGLQGEADALVTTDPSLGLLVTVADCCPVLVWDPSAGVLAVAHAGWRGFLAGVLDATIRAMEGLGAVREELRVWIGPSIGPCCFEVGSEVAERFAPTHVVDPEPTNEGDSTATLARPHVDLGGACVSSLVDLGLVPDRVSAAADCTSCRSDLYWSYRRDGGICGRHVGYLTRRV